jgi:hypothetical protein
MTEYPNITADHGEEGDAQGFGSGQDADRSFTLLTGASLGIPASVNVITDATTSVPAHPSRQIVVQG